MGNRWFHENMNRFIHGIWGRYELQPFDIVTTTALENDIRNKIIELLPCFYSHVRIDGKEIHVSGIFFEQYAATMQFLPCMFTVQERYFYNLYIDNEEVGTILFEKNLDPCTYGYVVTVNLFEMCEYIRKALNADPETEEVIGLTEIPPVKDVEITINYEETKNHDEQKPD